MNNQKLNEAMRRKIDRLLENPDKPAYIPEPPKQKAPRDPQEFIRNIWGSSAGVGSGDFHIYRGIRRREYAREQHREKIAENERLDEEFEEKIKAQASALEAKQAKKRAKRLKKKQARKKNKGNVTSKDPGEESSEDEGAKPPKTDCSNDSPLTDDVTKT